MGKGRSREMTEAELDELLAQSALAQNPTLDVEVV